MYLGVRDAAGLLGVDDKTIYRWIREDSLPAVRVGGQYRFDRAELQEWAASRSIPLTAGAIETAAESSGAGLRRALESGGIVFGITGADKDSVLQASLDAMPLPADVDRAFLLHVLKAREAMGSTGLGDGIAVPHVRNPIVLDIPGPMITLCFLEEAVEFGALDGRPVDTLFMLVSPTIDSHLFILSRIAFALRQPAFAEAVCSRRPGLEILEQAGLVDAKLEEGRAGRP
jgi:PTS system nitrogen regulatory IIA component